MNLKNNLLVLGFLTSATAMAGSIDYLSQQDAEYLAHPAMVGKIGVSGAYYNPAGLVWLEDGTYMQVNNQTHLKTYSQEYGDYKFESDKPSAMVPSLQVVHKKGDMAYFFHAGAIAGGGSVEYKGGVGTFPSIADRLTEEGSLGKVNFVGGSNVEGESYYITLQAGIAKKLTKSWSGAIGIRAIDAQRRFKGTGNFTSDNLSQMGVKNIKFDIDSERTAFGVSGIFGLNYHPNEKFNLGMRYETETKLDFDNKENNLRNGFNGSFTGFGNKLGTFMGGMLYDKICNDPSIKQWTKEGSGERNLPAMAALGMSYQATEKLTLLASGNYYFIKEAGDDIGNYDDYDNGYEVAVGLDYQLNHRWTLMTGYQYTNTGANENTYSDTDYPLDADMYSVGAKFKYSENLDLMASYSYVDYKTGTNKNTGITYKKKVDAFGLAAIYKF